MEQAVSLADLAQSLGPHRRTVAMVLVMLPLLGPLLGRLLLEVNERSAAWFLSLVVHLACFMIIPCGMLLAYLLLVARTNLFTEVDALLFYGPLLSGTFTLFLVPKVMALEDIPGFDRLLGLFTLVGVTSFLTFMLAKTRIFAGFIIWGGFTDLLLMALLLFALMRWALWKVSGSSDLDANPHLVEVDHH